MKFINVAIVLASIAGTSLRAANEPALIPQPQKMERFEGEFKLSPDAQISSDRASAATAEFLAARLRPATGYKFVVNRHIKFGTPLPAGILLTTNNANPGLGTEGYELTVTTNGMVIRAPAEAGLFYGAQTLLQLFPPEIFSSNTVARAEWAAPCAHVEDWPRFPWRGLMLDVSRHFYTKDEVERILDDMALFKLNTFHWHLADDQGWRIEIKKYPLLTQVSAWRSQNVLVPPGKNINDLSLDNAHPSWAAAPAFTFGPDGRYGGYYTQRDIREVVAYAAARHITIVPEIEMPGHCVAVLAAYPQLGCGDKPFSTDVNAGVNSGVYCPGKDSTFAFLDDVLGEVAGLFPGKFIHIGGDEVNAKVKAETWGNCPLCQKQMAAAGITNYDDLQALFVRRIEKAVSAHGKTLIGWSEIMHGGLPPNAAVMDWIGGATEAATSGHDVVMTPTKFCYLDYYQSTNHATEPHSIGGYLPLEKIYSFEPVPPQLPPEFQSHILGGQCNLWTEYVASLPHAEYMIFPRACALAEVTWSARSARDFNDFQRRLKTNNQRLGTLGINYRHDHGEAAKTIAEK